MAVTAYEQAQPRGRRRAPTRRGLVVRLLVVALIVGGLGYGLWFFNEFRNKAIADFFASNVPPPTPVAAAAAQSGPQPVYLVGIGSLTAIRQVEVAPEVAGRVQAISFEPGARVDAGRPLVQLNDDPEEAELESYRAQERLAIANLDRTRRLANRDFATQASLDQNQAALDQARAGIARTQAQIAQKLVRAPFNGELGIRQVELGQYVGPGTTLVTLTDLDTLYVNFTLPEQSRAEVRVSQAVEVTVDAYPGRTFTAALTTIEPQIDPGTRTIKLQATLANADHALQPGMFANARVVLPPRPDVVTVPETAVTRTLYGDSVFIAREEKDGQGQTMTRAVQTFVRTGEVAQGRITVSEGVRPGDMVIGSGQLKLQNGAPVKLVDDKTLAIPGQIPVQ